MCMVWYVVCGGMWYFVCVCSMLCMCGMFVVCVYVCVFCVLCLLYVCVVCCIVYVCVLYYVCVVACVCVCMCGGRGWHQMSFLSLSPFYLKFTCLATLTGHSASFGLLPKCTNASIFLGGVWRSNSGQQACMASTYLSISNPVCFKSLKQKILSKKKKKKPTITLIRLLNVSLLHYIQDV